MLLEYRKGNDGWDQGLVGAGPQQHSDPPITTRCQSPEDRQWRRERRRPCCCITPSPSSLSWDFNVRSVHTEDLEVGFDTGAVLKDLVTLSRKDRDQDNNHHDNFVDTSLTDIFHTGPIGHRLLAGVTIGKRSRTTTVSASSARPFSTSTSTIR